MPKWFNNGNDESEDDPGKAVEKKFETLETSVKEIKDNTVSKTEFQTVADGVAAINRRFAAEDDERKKIADRKKAEERQQQDANYDPEKEFETFASDPRAYLNRAQQPTNQATLLALGKQKIAEVLTGKPYYNGQFKADVDNAILTGTKDYGALQNVEYILNCYHVIYGRYSAEDKLKDQKRAVSLEMGGDGQSGGDRTDKDAKDTVQFRSDSMYSEGKAKHAAAMLGLTDDDVIKTAKEGTIKGLEVVQ